MSPALELLARLLFAGVSIAESVAIVDAQYPIEGPQ